MRVFDCLAYFHVNDGKLEPKIMKDIFPVYAIGVKGYMWCPDPKSYKFVFSRDVTFDETFMLHPKKEYAVDATCSEEKSRKSVELENKVKKGVQECTHIEPVDATQSSTLGNDTTREQNCSIVTERARKQICPPKRYAYADIVSYALSAVIEISEHSTYKGAISCGEVAK